MADAPSDRSTLYRKLRRIVTVASVALAVTQLSPGQASRRGTVDKGPRALGLIELAANGKAHLIPITIMYDGRFYDAGAYKAAPVPMALESGTVYEAVKSGVSQGLFTVAGAAHAGPNWVGEGTWKSAEQLAAAAAKREVVQAKPTEPESDRPPVFRRSGSEKSNPPETAKPAPAPTAPSQRKSSNSERRFLRSRLMKFALVTVSWLQKRLQHPRRHGQHGRPSRGSSPLSKTRSFVSSIFPAATSQCWC